MNTRRKDAATGEWTEKPNYFDITVWGNQGENCAQYLSKGRPVGVDGRLEWREWEAQDGSKRQAVEVIADTVQFLGGRGEGGGDSRSTSRRPRPRRPTPTSAPQPTTTSRSRRSDGSEDRQEDRQGRQGGRKRARPARSGASRCFFCKDKIEEIDYKNVNQLRRYISEKGKIR